MFRIRNPMLYPTELQAHIPGPPYKTRRTFQRLLLPHLRLAEFYPKRPANILVKADNDR